MPNRTGSHSDLPDPAHAPRDGKGVAVAPSDDMRRHRVIAEFRARTTRAFLKRCWLARGSGATERALLDQFLIEKAGYEIAYDAANRPTWVGVPLTGLSALAERILGSDVGARNG